MTALRTHYHYVIFYFQTFGHNCARQRDKIPTLLEEFAIAQEEVILRCHIPISNCLGELGKVGPIVLGFS